ncbi:site-specific integrase [Photobacterium sagamiensis]|uniref:tyrosine-type recombinase/integrase n=1 Tax=Photobacterium sagamiensis TaxID=2910241 RepID=UPI003D12C0CA
MVRLVLMVNVFKQSVNIGELPYFSSLDAEPLRRVDFHQDHHVDKFPRLHSVTRIADVLEMNLFLDHRYKGIFMPPKRGGKANSLGGVSLLTINSLAYSLSLFLQWLEDHNVAWQEVIAVAATEKAKYWLPVYRFRKHLIHRVESKEIDRDTANLYMNHIRQFYEWALKQRRIEKIPFEYKTKIIKKKRKDGDIDYLFAVSYAEERGIPVTTTDLLIPKKYKQKKFDHGELAPYTREELELLYSSKELTKPASRLWIELAHLCGLRADEVASFPANKVQDPTLSSKKLFHIAIVGKFDKRRTIMVSEQLMRSLWNHLNSPERQYRLAKWQLEHGDVIDAPLFLNRSGRAILAKSVGNVIAKVRKELKAQDLVLERDFHDLRSTFATNLAKFMLKKNLPLGFIQYKLMQLLGHSNFSTTQKYINFAQSETFDKQMASWVDKLFGEHLPSLHDDLVTLQGDE